MMVEYIHFFMKLI